MIEIVVSLILAIVGGYMVGYYGCGCLIDIRMFLGWILLFVSMSISGSFVVGSLMIIPFLISLVLTIFRYGVTPPALGGN